MALFDVIKYEGDGNTLVYKYPNNEFNTKSQLIVQQSQEAVFYNRGEMADHFTVPGHYTLETKNIPILSNLINLPFGKESPFIATVFFIDKTERPNNHWGVGIIPFVDKEFGIPLSIGMSGEYSFKINNAILFIEKVLGTIGQYNTSDALTLIGKYIQRNVTAYMTTYMQTEQVDLLTMETQLVSVSDSLKAVLCANFADYGFELTQFVVTSISKHEDDKEFKRWYSLKTQAVQLAEIKMGESILTAKKEAEIGVAKVEQQGKIELTAQKKAGDLQLADYDIALKQKQERAQAELEIEIKEKQLEADARLAIYEAEAKKKLAMADVEIEASRISATGASEASAIAAKGRAEAEILAAKGLTGAQEMGYQVAMATAQNTGAGNMTSTGIGLGTMAGVVGPTQTLVGGLYTNALNQVLPNDEQQRKVTDLDDGTNTAEAMPFFGVGNAGLGYDEPVEQNQNAEGDSGKADRMSRLKEAKELFDMELITEEEFLAKKKEILNQI